MNEENKISAPDLTKRPPRSPRCHLGGLVTLPRLLDKARATIAGTNGEFKFGTSFDQHVMKFLGFDAAALQEELATDKGDGEILEWIMSHAQHKREPWEIEQWSDYMIRRSPESDQETQRFFRTRVGAFTKTREDIRTYMDLLDLDDLVTFGGKP